MIYPLNKFTDSEVRRFVFIFNGVGLLGFILPITHVLFIRLIPYALLLNGYILVAYHTNYTHKFLFASLLILLGGFFIEVIGVNTSLIFGKYNYGVGLGIKLFDTPLLIGFNWLFLVYTSLSLAQKISRSIHFQLFVTPSIMVVYDIVLEQVAPKLNMWSWDNNAIPLKNYVAWWIIGLLFTVILKIFRVDVTNKFAITLLSTQFMFFLLLYICIGLA